MRAILSGRSSWCPQWHQEPALSDDRGLWICVGGVGAGKSQVAGQWVLRMVFRHPRKRDGRPARGLILGKDFKNAGGEQFRVIRERVRELGLPEDDVIVDERGPGVDHHPTLTFWNGVEVQAFTGTDPDSTRGYEADWLWADEAECMSAVSLATSLGRLRSAECIRAIVTSNPGGYGGWIYPMLSGENPEWDEIRKATKVYVFRWSHSQNSLNAPAVSRSLKAMYRAISPDLEKQELGGRFLGTSEAPGSGAIDFVKAFVGRIELTPDTERRAVVVGADLGKSEDFCWFTAVSRGGVVLGMDRFNISEIDVDDQGYWPLVRERLLSFAASWGATSLVIDAARGGDQFAALVREKVTERRLGYSVEDVRTDFGGKKTSLVESLGMAMGMGRFVIPTAWTCGATAASVAHVEALRLEFKNLQKRVSGSRVSYTHLPGRHDDGIVSCGLAWLGLSLAPSNPLTGDFVGFGRTQKAAAATRTFGGFGALKGK